MSRKLRAFSTDSAWRWCRPSSRASLWPSLRDFSSDQTALYCRLMTESAPKTSGIMLAERGALIRGIPRIFDELSEHDRSRLYAIGKSMSFAPDTPIFSQGDEHQGIHLIETGRVHSYYKAPSGRAVTLAYWLPGNFVGAPAMFGGGTHMWELVAVQNTTTIFLAGRGATNIGHRLGGHRAVVAGRLGIQGALLFDHGADARHALGQRASQASLAVSRERLWPERAGRNRYCGGIHPGRARKPDRIDAAVGDGPAGAVSKARESSDTVAVAFSSFATLRRWIAS